MHVVLASTHFASSYPASASVNGPFLYPTHMNHSAMYPAMHVSGHRKHMGTCLPAIAKALSKVVIVAQRVSLPSFAVVCRRCGCHPVLTID